MELKEALNELRKLEKKKFDQSIDLIVNLKSIDLKGGNVNAIIDLPHKIGDKKVCAFLTKKSDLVDSVIPIEFQKYKDKVALKNLIKNYDFFIGAAQVMPAVASTFGKVLGPAGKMPSPQLGVLMQENDSAIKTLLEKIGKSIKIRAKEASIKLSIGKESMENEQILENLRKVYNGILNALPNKKENIRNVMIKLTMSKPIKVEIK